MKREVRVVDSVGGKERESRRSMAGLPIQSSGGWCGL